MVCSLDSKSDSSQPPAQLLKVVELILDPATSGSPADPTSFSSFSTAEPGLLEVTRAAGKNDIGMVAWKLTLCTPEYPQGREVVLIANDITFQSGTFGPREDLLFALASKYARKVCCRSVVRLLESDTFCLWCAVL